jgi:hypothetical protein
MTREELEPCCRWVWNTHLANIYGTFDKYVNLVYMWAIENPSTATEIVKNFNLGEHQRNG